MDEQLAQDRGGFDAAAGGEAGEMVEQAARPRLVPCRENRGRCGHGAAEPAQQVGTAGNAEQRIGVGDLEACEQRLVLEVLQCPGVGAQGIAGMRRKCADREHREARQCEPFRTADLVSCRPVAKPPVRAGAGVEQHADDGEIEFRACPRGAVAPIGSAGERRPAVLSATYEMPPSRMKGNIEIGIGRARDFDGEVGGTLKLAEIDPEMRQLVGEPLRQEQVRAFAHGGGAQERQRGACLGLGVRGAHAQYFSSGRPTVGSCGAGSGE